MAVIREDMARGLAGAGAMAGWTALAVQLVVIVNMVGEEGGTLADGLWRFVGYFSYLANGVAAAALTRAALAPGRRTGLNHPVVELSLAAALVVVDVVYAGLLRPLWDPEGWDLVAGVVLHDVLPVAFVVHFLLRGHDRLPWPAAAWAALAPGVYFVYALARGAGDGWYAYFFLDPVELSGARFAVNAAVLAVSFVAVALALIGLGRLTARRRG